MNTNTNIAVETFECKALAVSKGKGSNATSKVALAKGQGAYIGVLLQEGVARKAILAEITAADAAAFAEAVANAKYDRPLATIVAISGLGFTYTVVNGDVPRSDWLRCAAELRASTSKAAGKALRVWTEVQAAADVIRAARSTKIAA